MVFSSIILGINEYYILVNIVIVFFFNYLKKYKTKFKNFSKFNINSHFREKESRNI